MSPDRPAMELMACLALHMLLHYALAASGRGGRQAGRGQSTRERERERACLCVRFSAWLHKKPGAGAEEKESESPCSMWEACLD